MRPRLRASPYRLDRIRYRAVTDPQAAMERWWAELARVFPRGAARAGDTGGDARQSARSGREGEG
ncbi:MAG TPA: hypothetical protein VEQ60_08090 [Longimicrobium sp.]|nr:hypothetical protein [Longimicrobium sp.]